MRTILKSVAIAVTLAGATLAGAGTANAAVGISFDLGNVAVGYSDGYYDNGHHWHNWARRADMVRYQGAHRDQYHGWRHDDKHHH